MALHPRDPALLRKAMTSAGHDTVSLAKAAGVTRAHISLVLRGARRCSAPTAAAIAGALAADIDALFVVDLTGEKVNIEESEVKTSTTVEDDPYLLFEEVAEMARMPERTLRHLRATKQGPPFFRRGRRLFIRRSRAIEWIESYEVEAETAQAAAR